MIGLLGAYVENPNVWTDDFDIPESGNGIPDILDEVKWGLDWLERMQNQDGSMLSILALEAASPPSAARGASRYGPSNSSATITSTKFSELRFSFSALANELRMPVTTCLLYTSPSPRDGLLSRMPSSA